MGPRNPIADETMNEGDKSTPEPVLEVDNLRIAYETRRGDVEAVRGVSFTVCEGHTLGLVGESGCGKSTIAFGIVNFLGSNGRIVEGSIRFQGQELVGRTDSELRKLRGDRIAVVYQDPMQALNPSVPVGDQLMEVLTCHQKVTAARARERSIEMLRQVHMPDADLVMRRYPHQISGGQQQRVVIAMAMLNNPSLLIMDEPTTALDVTVEAAVLDLIEELKDRYRTANIFITHNLGVVARVSDSLCVMYAGELVERGSARDIFKTPCHPYTMGLLASVPRLGESKAESVLQPIRGRVPPPSQRPEGRCIFAPRCDYVTEACRRRRPDPVPVVSQGSAPGLPEEHAARCLYAQQMANGARKPTRRPKPTSPGDSGEDSSQAPLLSLENLKVYYPQESNSLVSLLGLGEKRHVRAVDDVSIRLSRGKTLGIVGESGCGKSTLVKGIIGLEPLTDGGVEFLGLDVNQEVSERDAGLIREMQMVFQNPDSTLNPSYSVGKQIARPIKRFKTVPRKEVKEEVLRLLRAVRLDGGYYDRFPRQLSGGEKQRVGIARALASRPDLIICDEPVSALDVSVQAAVINLLMEIQQTFGASMIFIAHDLSVVRFFSDDIAVMYLGQIVEVGPAEVIYSPPYHPYTEALLSSVPIPDPETRHKGIRLGGNVPSALDPPSGCRFHPRCPRRREMLPDGGRMCERERPPWRDSGRGHRILCHIPLDELSRLDSVLPESV